MIIKLPDISPEGLEFHEEITVKEYSKKKNIKKAEWFQKAIEDSLGENLTPGSQASLSVRFDRTGRNVFLSGTVDLSSSPQCARCTERYQSAIHLDLMINMAPADEKKRSRDEEEAVDDENFIFYEGEVIDLGEVLREQIELDKPIRTLCREDCKGLCPSCGNNLNTHPCKCTLVSQDSPFKVLKDIVKQ